jgi:glycerol uptake facilitator-like aquaporin
MDDKTLPKKLVAELLGTMGLIIAVIGSVKLADNAGFGTLGFIACGLAAAFVLFAMIEALGKISGGHFNPAVTIAMITSKDISIKTGLFYMIAQILGGLIGAVFMLVTFYNPDAGFTFELLGSYPNNLAFLAISEFLCVFVLVVVVFSCVRNGSKKTSLAVGATVGGMIMCTASTFFANPAVDIARIFADGGSQITPIQSIVYILVAIIAAIIAAVVMSWLYPKESSA